jgi:hypothetical protein
MRRCRFISAAGCALSVCSSTVADWPDVSHADCPDIALADGIMENPGTAKSFKQQLLDALGPSISEDLELDFWGWIAGLHQPGNKDYWDLVLSMAVTKSFDQRVTISAQGNLISANGDWRLELGQGYLSALLLEDCGTIFTIGKFNANFGLEQRDFWNRPTGTTSLLFGAQPQDLIGFMVTQPIGDSGIKVKPFVSADFQGGYNFDQPPSGGISLEWQPSDEWEFKLTNWIGPGFVLDGGEPLDPPYPMGSYGEDPAAVIGNWQGPNFVAERAGTLYYVQAAATWYPSNDLTLGAEFLLGTTRHGGERFGWNGFTFLGVYDITDRLHFFARFSYLSDPDWLVTGFFQTRREVSCGFGYFAWESIELRGEYRHDFSNAFPDVDTWSIHLAFTY